MKRLQALRYLQPLREGGSLPAVVETDDGLYVVKFRGAGQGPAALVAELIAGGLARELGFDVPELAVVELASEFGADQGDPEIRDLLRASAGDNVGLRYLDGAFNFDTLAAHDFVTPELAADIVWLDALLTNPDRSHRNPNMMVCDRRLWLIDHGTALYAHHDWASVDEERARTRFPLIKQHVLLAGAGDLHAADARLRVTDQMITRVLDAVPDSLLVDPFFASAAAARERYAAYLRARLREPRDWVAEAVQAQEQARREPPQRKRARR